MFKFDKEQEVFDFAGVKMGGQPGEYPTVLAGTIFYGGHNIINDELIGDFDKARAEQLVNEMASISDVTGKKPMPGTSSACTITAPSVSAIPSPRRKS